MSSHMLHDKYFFIIFISLRDFYQVQALFILVLKQLSKIQVDCVATESEKKSLKLICQFEELGHDSSLPYVSCAPFFFRSKRHFRTICKTQIFQSDLNISSSE